MAVTYVIRFEVVPERLDDFHELLCGVLDAMRQEPTFHEAILHRDPASKYHFMLYETWKSHEDACCTCNSTGPIGKLGTMRSPRS